MTGGSVEVEKVLSSLSLEEKIALLSGASAWSTKAFPEHDIPALIVSDGPHGLRKLDEGDNDHLGFHASIKSTCFPTLSALGSSWDVDLAHRMGTALAYEAINSGVNIILGPGVNMKRNPLCGRNFEYLSEDPFHAGKMATAWIKGVQENGIGVSLKHFACNNQESKRMSSNSLVDERALREYYLPAFERAVEEAHPVSLMCAYNKLNGVYCSDNSWLLSTVLRDCWGFEGIVMSDWGGTTDRVEGIKAGLELEMPGSRGYFDSYIESSIKVGDLDEAYLDRATRRLLKVIDDLSGSVQPQPADDVYEKNHRLAYEIAAASAVLLKNEDNILPLCSSSSIAVVGALAQQSRLQGGGSSTVVPTVLTNLLGGLNELGRDYEFEPGYRLTSALDEELLVKAVDLAASKDVVICCLGLREVDESEGYDRTTLSLPKNQLALLDVLSKVNKNLVVVLVGGSVIDMPWIDSTKAVLHTHLSGQAGGQATADLLCGKKTPSGKLQESYPQSYKDVVSSEYYGVQPKQAAYIESMFCGYRYFDSAKKEVLFPFGFGLSYTTFVYDGLEIASVGTYDYRISFTVCNTGTCEGAEVAQLYVSPETKGVYRPVHELKGFKKVKLSPGETAQITLELDKRSFAYFDTEQSEWQVESGPYLLEIGSSSRDIRLQARVELEGKDPKKSDCSSWYYTLEGKPKKSDFVSLYGEYANYHEQTKGSYDLSSSISDMKETSLLCRMIFSVMEKVIARQTGSSIDYENARFKTLIDASAENPIKSLPLFTARGVSFPLALFILDSANGHTLRGLMSLILQRRFDNQSLGGKGK